MASIQPHNSTIATTLDTHGIIINKQLSYINNIPSHESRLALSQYLTTNKQNIFPIYIVSGFRYVHNQLSYVYLITRPTLLQSTQSKFQTVVSVQIYGLVKADEEPTSQQLQQLLLLSESIIAQSEFDLLSQQPVLDSNPLRNNEFSAISSPHIARKANAYTVQIKPVKNDLVHVKNLLESDISTPKTPITMKNSTIVQNQNKISFGTKSNVSKIELDIDNESKSPNAVKRSAPSGQSASLFDDFDDDIPTKSKSSTFKSTPTTKDTKSTSKSTTTTTTTTGKGSTTTTTTKSSPFGPDPNRTKPTHNLFDEFDDEPDVYISSRRPSTTKNNNNKKTTVKAKKAELIIDSEDDEDDENDDFGAFGAHEHLMGNDDDDELFDDDNDMNDKKKKKDNTPVKKSFMGDSDSDDDMVKFAKGNTTTTTTTKSKTTSTTTKTNNNNNNNNKVIIDSDDDDDSELYSKTMTKANASKSREKGFYEISKAEMEQIANDEGWNKSKNLAPGAKEPEGGNATKNMINSGTRFNEETGKHQKLVKRMKTEVSIDEDGFEVTKKVEVEEWIDYVPAQPKAVVAKTETTTTTITAKTTVEKKPTKKEEKEKEKPKTGGILNFFGKK